MISIDMSSLWLDDVNNIAAGIQEGTRNIIAYRRNSSTSKAEFLELLEDIKEICNHWSSGAYLGTPKNAIVKDAFQEFFCELMKLLLMMKDSKKSFEAKLAKNILFRGTIYRYLGSDNKAGNRVMLEYNDYYVSWSKSPANSYIQSKLYSPIMFLTCEVEKPLYGIDLEAIYCSCTNEREVVFPTLKNLITRMEYIEDSEEDSFTITSRCCQ